VTSCVENVKLSRFCEVFPIKRHNGRGTWRRVRIEA